MKESVNEHNQHQLYWKRLYNSLGLWISIYLILIALGFYMIEVDFAFTPHKQIKSPSKNLSKSVKNPTNESSRVNKLNSIVRSETMFTDYKGL